MKNILRKLFPSKQPTDIKGELYLNDNYEVSDCIRYNLFKNSKDEAQGDCNLSCEVFEVIPNQ